MRERLTRSARREAVSAPQRLGAGRPLRSDEREAVGATSGTFRLENIRIHADERAAAAVDARGADAMAHGSHVLLPRPSAATPDGRALIRHEVAHALQHQAGLTATQSVDTLEAQAHAAESGAMPTFAPVAASPLASPILLKPKPAKKKKAPAPENLAVTHEGGVEGVDTDLLDDLALRIAFAFGPQMIEKGKKMKEVPSLIVLRQNWKKAAKLIQNPKMLRGEKPKKGSEYESLSELFDAKLADQLEALTDDEREAVAAEVERRVVDAKQSVPTADLQNEFSQLHANIQLNLSGGFLGWVAMREGLMLAFKDLARLNEYYSKLVPAEFPSKKVKGNATLVHPKLKARLDLALGVIKSKGWLELVEKALGTRGLWATQVRENTANPIDVGTHAFGWAVDMEPGLNPDIRPFPAIFKDVTGDDAGTGASVVAMRQKDLPLADAMQHSKELRDMSDRLVDAFKNKDAIVKAISAYLKREGASDLSDAERTTLGDLLETAAGADKKSQAAAIARVETFVLAAFDKERSARAVADPGTNTRQTAMEDSLWVTEMTRTLGGLSASPGDLDARWAHVQKQIDTPEAKPPADAKKLGLSPIYSKESVKTLKALTPPGRLQTKESLRRNLELRMHGAQAARTSGRSIDIFKLFLAAEKERPKDPVDHPTAAGVAAHGFQSLPPNLVGPLVAKDPEGGGLRWLGVMWGEKDTMHFELRPDDWPELPGGKYPEFLRKKGSKPAPDVVPEGDPAA